MPMGKLQASNGDGVNCPKGVIRGQLTPSEGERFSQGRKRQLNPESCGLTHLDYKVMRSCTLCPIPLLFEVLCQLF